MDNQEVHKMLLAAVHPSGVEEWYCPACGRRLLMQWPPAYKKMVLEYGDETAIHTGGNGGLNVLTSAGIPEEEVSLSLEEREALSPWIEWMERVNFAAWWDRKIEE
jgi:hypothetical protein